VRFVPYPEARGLEEAPGYDELLGIWPEFLLHDRISNRYWSRLYSDFPAFQFLALLGDRVVGEGNSVPVRGLPAHWRDAFPNAWEGDGEPDRLCALAIIVAPEQRGAGLSAQLLEHMRELAAPFGSLVAPVRPTLKARYPLIPINTYVGWRGADGAHFDPWIRRHEQAGGRILGAAEGAMLIEGSRDDWQEWTGLAFPGDGDYVVPGALAPVRFSEGHGVYREPCVWVEYLASGF
jgi:GNAT superfamily N-acetyltransferase